MRSPVVDTLGSVAVGGAAAAAPDRPLRPRLVRAVIVCGLVAGACLVLSPLVGPTPISLRRALDRSVPFAENLDAQIFFVARLPRAVAASVVGAALAAAGVVLQALLRNPLATPFTLGVSSGGALGAMLATLAGTHLALGDHLPAVPLASFFGALCAVAIVYGLARMRGTGLSTDVLLLAGVTLNSFFSALILFLQYTADATQTMKTLRWLMGDLDVAGYETIIFAAPWLLGAAFLLASLPSALNVFTFGPELAAARGVDVRAIQRRAFFGASLATGAAVSIGGPIGFMGIIVPHMVRLLFGADHRIVLPASALVGAAFLTACDVMARTLTAPMELPVGIVTAVIGGPFFLWLLLRPR